MRKVESPANRCEQPALIRQLQRGVAPGMAMLAGMQLEGFTALAGFDATFTVLARRLGVSEERLAPLLYALVLTTLLELHDGEFANSPETDRYLVKGRPGYIGGVHELWSDLWRADLHTAQSIRTGKPQAKHDFAAGDREGLTTFLRGLAALALPRGRGLAQDFDFSLYRTVLDVGGGSGSTLIGLLEAHPRLHASLFDLPQVAEIARTLLRDQEHADRINVLAGDITRRRPEGRWDAALCVQLIQVLSPDQ